MARPAARARAPSRRASCAGRRTTASSSSSWPRASGRGSSCRSASSRRSPACRSARSARSFRAWKPKACCSRCRSAGCRSPTSTSSSCATRSSFASRSRRKPTAQFALSATDAQLDALEAAHRDVVKRAARGVTPALLDAAQAVDWGLHDTMIDALGNEIVSSIYRVNSLRIRLIRLDRVTLNADSLQPAMAEHLALLAALRTRDPAARGGGHGSPPHPRAQPRARTMKQDRHERTPPSPHRRTVVRDADAGRRRAARIDHARFAAHVHWLFAQGVDGIAPFGTTGEGQSFSVDERRAGLDALLAAGVPGARIVRRHRLRVAARDDRAHAGTRRAPAASRASCCRRSSGRSPATRDSSRGTRG